MSIQRSCKKCGSKKLYTYDNSPLTTDKKWLSESNRQWDDCIEVYLMCDNCGDKQSVMLKTFCDWEYRSMMETHHEIVQAIELALHHDKHHDDEYLGLKDIDGKGGSYELAIKMTEEFENIHRDREWDGTFFEEVEAFIDAKLKGKEYKVSDETIDNHNALTANSAKYLWERDIVIILNRKEQGMDVSDAAIGYVKEWLAKTRKVGEQEIEGRIQLLFTDIYNEYMEYLEEMTDTQQYPVHKGSSINLIKGVIEVAEDIELSSHPHDGTWKVYCGDGWAKAQVQGGDKVVFLKYPKLAELTEDEKFYIREFTQGVQSTRDITVGDVMIALGKKSDEETDPVEEVPAPTNNTDENKRWKVGMTALDDDTGKYYTALDVDAINVPLHFQVSGRTEAESRSIADWLGNLLIGHIPNR